MKKIRKKKIQIECRQFKRPQSKEEGEEKKEEKYTTIIAFNGDGVTMCDDNCVNLTCQD